MPFLKDFADAVKSYISDSVTLSIVDVNPPGNTINVGEVCTFQARVANDGNLDMSDVSLEITGLNGTQVGTSSTGPWSSSIVVNSPNVPAGGTIDTANLYFQAPAVEKPPFTTLVNVQVRGWNAGLRSLLANNSRAEAAIFGHYTSEVFPS